MENRIRELRVARSWSQATLGDALGVSRQTVNAIENGRYDPSLPLAFKIAALFEEPIEALFTPDLVDVELQPDATERSAHETTAVS